jgi:hypothetical protein
MLINHFKSTHLTCVSTGSLCIAHFRGAPELSDLDAAEAAVKKVAGAQGKAIYLAFIEGVSIKVPEEIRNRGTAMVKAIETSIDASPTVILGSGIATTIIRTLVSGINAASRSKSPSKTFDTMEAALTWLQTLPCKDKITSQVRADALGFASVKVPAKAA